MSIDHLTLIDRSIRYDADTGALFWRVDRGTRAKRNRPAGTVTRSGFIRIGLGSRYFDARDVAWFLGHGEWPPAPVGHLNGNVRDNLTLLPTAPPAP